MNWRWRSIRASSSFASAPMANMARTEYLGRPGYDAMAQAFGGMMNVTGDPSGPPQRAKVFTGDYITALTGWASTMMALWEVKKTGRGQVIDLAQYEAVAQTQGNSMPLYTGQGGVYGHSGNRAPGFQPYDTFKCSDGWVFIGALGGSMFPRLPPLLALDPLDYSYDSVFQVRGGGQLGKGPGTRPPFAGLLRRAHGAGGRDGIERRSDRLRTGVQHARPVRGRTL